MGEQIIIADVDILFLKPFSQTLSEDLKDCDMVIATHSKGTRLDTGFMGLNCSTKLLMFFERILPTISISQSALEDSLFKNLHSIKYQLLDRRYANRSNNGLDIYPDECYLFHANFEDRTPRSHHKFRNLRRKWLRIQEGIPRTPPLTPQRNKKLKLKMKSEEAFLENFFSRECLRHQEDDEDLDCEKMWKDYQNELHKPGCKSCVKRKIISKYYNLLKGYE
jgi:hypothetical protein